MPKLGRYKGILDTVFFLYPSAEDARRGTAFGGTGFLTSIPTKRWPERSHVYGVTNWHVACRGSSVVRLNTLDGAHDIFDLGPESWHFIPGGHDVAVAPLSIQNHHNAMALEHGFLLTSSEMVEKEIGPGDDVFMVGRFVDYAGHQTNKPAARFGHISMIDAPIRVT